MKVISFQDIVSLNIEPSRCYDWAEKMIVTKEQAMLPPKISIKPRDGVFCNVMPSMIPEDGQIKWGGVKVVTRYPKRTPSLESQILLIDVESGEFIALMDGTWITAMRTGAVATHSISLFAKQSFSTIGIMGLGNVIRSTLLILNDRLEDRDIHIKLLRYKGQEIDFMDRFREFKNYHFSAVDTPEEMVRGSDVVLSGATYLPIDVCNDEFFGEGILVQPIHTLGFTNCDLFFDKVFADDTDHVRNFKNFNSFKKYAEVCDVVNSEKPGRENDSERILVYNIGISVHDICFAASIYQLMESKGILKTLPDVNMDEPIEKFWV